MFSRLREEAEESPEFSEDELLELNRIFKTLSDTSKIRILSMLDQQESLSVSEIAKNTGLEISLVSHHLKTLKLLGFVIVSHHLKTLKLLGFVKPRKAGKQVFYSIEDDCIIDILQRAKDHVAGN
ncbi:MAG: ArsR/SmtB family transcription factor [Candidatus Thorarchaeota archaeon]|jgi:ArsR family transcriptional regulator